MAQRAHRPSELIVERGRPLFSIPDVERGDLSSLVVLADDRTEDERRASLAEALSAIGSWGHLDADEVLDVLDRIRHESKPTPPIDDL